MLRRMGQYIAAFSVLLCASFLRAQPTVPKNAPIPPRIVPGGANPAPQPIKPASGPKQIEIAPSTSPQQPITPPPFKTADIEKIDPADLNNSKTTNRFVMALCADKEGRLWIGTEDEGVWRYDENAPQSKRWTQFTTKDGLGDDNAYAVACDKQNRIWIGHLNHGVSVYNGQSWKNYDVLDGPLGERVFDIAVAPNDGSIWMATSAGLTRYLPNKDDWTYYTRGFSGKITDADWKSAPAPHNLPSDQIAALAFNAKGDLFAGTQCEGLAIARAADDYKTWQNVRAGKPIKAASGEGLPSDLINDVLIAKSGAIYVATARGLAWSSDGVAWKYLRGRDWQNIQEVAALPSSPHVVSEEALLREDWVNALAENPANGRLLIGYRQKGWEERALQTGGALGADTKSKIRDGLDDVRAILPQGDKVTMAFYGAGARLLSADKLDSLFQLPNVTAKAPPVKIESAPPVQRIVPTPITITSAEILPKAPPKAPTPPKENMVPGAVVRQLPFPIVARPPSLAEMQEMLKQVSAVPADNDDKIQILPLNDDWRTQGDCLDRYGRHSAVFCAINGGGNNGRRGYWDAYVWHRDWMGSNHRKGDSLRYWVGTLWTDDPRALQYPVFGRRRFAEHDDHGETYPPSQDGPHIYETLHLPKGHYVLALYFVNDDGHGGPNRWRDYAVDVRSTPMELESFLRLSGVGVNNVPVETIFDEATIKAQSRVGQFWGGVYKRFYVNANEPSYITIKINRNHSFNTILSGIFLDPVGEFGMLGYNAQPAVPRKPLSFSNDKIPEGTKADVAIHLMDRLLALRDSNPAWYAMHSRPYFLALLRCLLTRDSAGNFMAKQIEEQGAYADLRRDVASCLNSAQLFDKRDQVFYDEFNQVTWDWVRVTPLNRKFNGDIHQILKFNSWDSDGFDRFIAAQKAKQSWP